MDQVRILREARGWTQQHLADASGLSLRTIQRVESGEVTPSRETLLALSGAFDVQLRADDGPHVVLTKDSPEILPGCRVLVFKDGWCVPCVTRLDSRTRTVTRHGMVLLDFTFDEIERRVSFKGDPSRTPFVEEGDDLPDGAQDGCFIFGGRHYYYKSDSLLVDGEPWDGHEHPVTFPYDAVIVRGPQEILSQALLEEKIPRHWVVLPVGGQRASG